MNGALYDAVLALPERLGLGHLRALALGDVRGRVLEVGAGTGANAPYLGGARMLVQTEPDPAMLKRARTRWRGAGPGPLLVLGAAEALPFADRVFDSAVATLVLCSVQDPARSLREMARVTRPGGGLHLLEHVRAAWPLVASLQRALTPAWSRMAGGCHLDRDPADLLVAAGWAPVRRRRLVGSLLTIEQAQVPRTGVARSDGGASDP